MAGLLCSALHLQMQHFAVQITEHRCGPYFCTNRLPPCMQGRLPVYIYLLHRRSMGLSVRSQFQNPSVALSIAAYIGGRPRLFTLQW